MTIKYCQLGHAKLISRLAEHGMTQLCNIPGVLSVGVSEKG